MLISLNLILKLLYNHTYIILLYNLTFFKLLDKFFTCKLNKLLEFIKVF